MTTATIPLISFIVSLIFAITVLDQYFARRKAYQLVWAIGLIMYGLGTFMEYWTGTFGLNATVYRLWYLFGAICGAAYLGMGTLYLLMKRRAANIWMILLLIFTAYSAIRLFTSNIDVSGQTTLAGLKVVPVDIVVVTGLLNTFGTFALVGGAVWSAWIFWRKRILPHRVISNVLIALGAMLPAIGGTSLRLGGSGLTGLWIFELAGIIIIFVGFLRSKEVFGFYRFPLIHGFNKVSKD